MKARGQVGHKKGGKQIQKRRGHGGEEKNRGLRSSLNCSSADLKTGKTSCKGLVAASWLVGLLTLERETHVAQVGLTLSQMLRI